MQQTPQEQQPVQQDTGQKQPQRVMTGVRKRQQIQNTHKKTFLWLAVSAVIISACLVAMQFLIREFLYNQKIINKKSETNTTLVNNVKEAEKLRTNINELLANSDLNALKYEAPNVETTALNVILDALPVEGDATNFANSLQAVVLPRSGVTIKDLSTSTTAASPGAATDAEAAAVSLGGGAGSPIEVPFSAGFMGSYDKVQAALTDMSRVIRPVSLKKMTILATGDSGLQVNIDGVTYYQPARNIEVRKEVMKP